MADWAPLLNPPKIPDLDDTTSKRVQYLRKHRQQTVAAFAELIRQARDKGVAQLVLCDHPDYAMQCGVLAQRDKDAKPVPPEQRLPSALDLAPSYHDWVAEHEYDDGDEWKGFGCISLTIVWAWLRRCWAEAGGLEAGAVQAIMFENGCDRMMDLASGADVEADDTGLFADVSRMASLPTLSSGNKV